MNRFSKGLALTLAVGLIGAQTIAFSSNPQQTTSKPQTMVEWVKAHPNATVEYHYNTKLLAQNDHSSKTVLRGGTPVQIKLTEPVNSSDSTQGGTITFRVLSDVKIDGVTLVRAGELGHAQITTVDDNGFIGSPGKVVVSDFAVKAVDGSYVPLRATLSEKGKDRMMLSVIVGLFVCAPFLLIKGGEAEIPAGTEKTVYVAADVDVAV